MKLIHNRLHYARGIGGRRMAVDPALGMHDVADAITDAAYQVSALFEVRDKGVHLRFIREELDIVSRGPAKVSTAVLLGDVAHLTDIFSTHQARSGNAYGIQFVAGLGDMLHHTLAQVFMVLPLPIV